jgi:hypothetical protein
MLEPDDMSDFVKGYAFNVGLRDSRIPVPFEIILIESNWLG